MTTTYVRPATALFDEDELRIEGHDKVSGRTQFTADVQRPNMLWAAYATSPFAYARVGAIDTTAARAVPGVKAILTGADIGPVRLGRQVFDWPVLAYDVVRFIGDRVAAVAAETREAAEEAARRIVVAYEELEPLLTPAAAMADGAPVLHPEWPDYHYLAYQSSANPTYGNPNVHAWSVLEKGDADLDALFAGAHRVYEHRFETPRQHCGYIEPHSTLVWIDDDGTVHVVSPNKSPFALRMQLAHVAGIPAERIVVETSAIGGDFGGKGLTVDEFPCFFLARATGRPVRRVQSYTDELQGMTTRHPAIVTLKTAIDATGKFIAHRSQMLYNGGAYAAGKPTPSLLQAIGYGTVPYRIPNVRLDILSVYTNTNPSAHMRSPADVQTYFAWEQHVDLIASDLGIDPLEFRMLNAIREGDTAVTGETVRNPRAYAVLEALRDNVRWNEPLPAGRARGIALACRHTGHGKTSLRMRLTASGSIDVLTGVPDQGSGGHTVIRRVAAATLSVAPERISVRRGNTADADLDPGAGASRVTHVVGNAAKVAAERMSERIASEWGLQFRDDAFVDTSSGKTLSIETVTAERGELEVTGSYDGDFHDSKDGDYSCSAFCLEVEVDRETGAFRIVDALLVAEVGQIINPVAHQGQLDGGFIYGVGGAMMEEMPVDESGKIATLSLGEYKLPTIMDIPPLRTVHVASAPGKGPYGAKMAGELSNSGVAPALANAIAHAVGARLMAFPLTSERLYDALNGRPPLSGA
jgi:CO/xanthine dehydrogenase Mo-binding subunit